MAPRLSAPTCGSRPVSSMLTPGASLAGVRLRLPLASSLEGPQSGVRATGPPGVATAPPAAPP
eukprot:10915739-Lingulodinium_polyedra.AAC.1